ncbi:MAG TPA: VirB8/TrbF family protein [Candidatus Binataceae bacterium]|nr:VirB8/TrbF family protein [Candidatus Binataceae bacterium]
MNSNPYVEARREWDERYADLVLGKRNWQIIARGLLLLSLILAAGVVWQSTRSRFIPYVVEVDKLGYGLTVPKALIPSTDPALVGFGADGRRVFGTTKDTRINLKPRT